MKGAGRKSRPSKRDIITLSDDDDSTGPAGKIAKREEAELVPSPELIELRQKLLEKDGTLQRAVQIAADLQSRVEFLEKLIDTKKPVVDGTSGAGDLEKSVADVSDVEADRGRARDERVELEEKYQRACEAAREAEMRAELAENLLDSKQNDIADRVMKADELEKRIIDLTTQSEQERDKLQNRIIYLTKERGDLEMKVGDLTNQLEEKNGLVNNLEWELRRESSDLLRAHRRVIGLSNKLDEERGIFKEDIHELEDKYRSVCRELRAADSRAEQAETRTVDELKRRVNDLATELDDERKKSAEERSKLEGKYQRLCREAELRADIAEILLDSKRDAVVDGVRKVDDVEKRVNGLATQLKEERGRSSELRLKLEENLELAHRAAREAESRAKQAECLLESKRAAVFDLWKKVDELEKRIIVLTTELEEERGRSNTLKRELRREASDLQSAHERIDELTGQLDQWERISGQLHLEEYLQQQSKMQQLQQLPEAIAVPHVEEQRRGAREEIDELPCELEPREGGELQQLQLHPAASIGPHKHAHPTNILHMIVADSPKAMPLDSALRQLREEFEKCDEREIEKFLNEKKKVTFECESCGESLSRPAVLSHFFSEEHIEKVRAHDAAVSVPAFNYWMYLLDRASLRSLVVEAQ